MIIEVYRGDGLRAGVPIVEPLLSDSALIQRGRAEMDQNAQPLNVRELDLFFRPGIRPGQLLSVEDPATGDLARGKVTGMSITLSRANLTYAVTLEEPR